MRYSIFTNDKKSSHEGRDKLLSLLSNDYILDEEDPEIVFIIGGDGTFLRGVRKYINIIDKVKFLGISSGTLGFLSEFHVSEIDEAVKLINSKTFKEESYHLIHLKHGDKEFDFVNEARIERIFQTLICDLYINDSYIETFRGNGFNIASSLGSTAYNRSLGGPLVNPNIECLILGEVAPINHNVYGSITSFVVLNKTDKITLKGDFTMSYFGGDTVFNVSLNEDKADFEITMSNKKITFARFKKSDYYDKLKQSYVKG